ncbi:hypothetical protein MCEMSEM18_00348 [Comamonadaceae bacterium]
MLWLFRTEDSLVPVLTRDCGTLVLIGAIAASTGQAFAQQSITLLNVSYDPTRELYVEFNAAFAK